MHQVSKYALLTPSDLGTGYVLSLQTTPLKSLKPGDSCGGQWFSKLERAKGYAHKLVEQGDITHVLQWNGIGGAI